MANTATRYAKAALTTGSVTLYTVPAATTSIVTEIVLTNTTATDRTVTLTFGGTAILSAIPVPANGIASFGMKQVLLTTEIIAGLADAAGVNIFISGVNVT